MATPKWRTLRKFTLEYCDLPTMLWNVAVLLRVLSLNIQTSYKKESLKITKGTLCAVNVWGAGRSERIWGKDAAIYRPERWLGDQPPVNPAGFLPFRYGRRACIGKKYATVILKTVLAYCVRELEFVSNAEHMQLKADILLRAASGHLIQVRLRNSKEKTL